MPVLDLHFVCIQVGRIDELGRNETDLILHKFQANQEAGSFFSRKCDRLKARKIFTIHQPVWVIIQFENGDIIEQSTRVYINMPGCIIAIFDGKFYKIAVRNHLRCGGESVSKFKEWGKFLFQRILRFIISCAVNVDPYFGIDILRLSNGGYIDNSGIRDQLCIPCAVSK